jgi:small subunit ribosomal protein S1
MQLFAGGSASSGRQNSAAIRSQPAEGVSMGGATSEQPDDELDFEALLDSDSSLLPPQRGEVRLAEILEIRSSEIVVDLTAKRDGIVPAQDIQRLQPSVRSSLHVGDTVPVYILNPSDEEGNLIVSINLGMQQNDWLCAESLLQSGNAAEVTITGCNQGGFLVDFGQIEGFIPYSHSQSLSASSTEQERLEALSMMVGQKIQVTVIEVNQSRRRLILSQREAERTSQSELKARLMQSLHIGDILTGTVRGVRDFGVFVDLGGADGLIHISELDWHRVSHPGTLVKPGDQIQVYVLELDHENKRIALSRRRAYPDPWEDVQDRYHLDQIVSGTVSNVVDFGAFIVLPDGIEGLLHVSEMEDKSLLDGKITLQQGDSLDVRVVRVEAPRRRIGFSQRPPAIHSDLPSSPETEESEVDQSSSSR